MDFNLRYISEIERGIRGLRVDSLQYGNRGIKIIMEKVIL